MPDPARDFPWDKGVNIQVRSDPYRLRIGLAGDSSLAGGSPAEGNLAGEDSLGEDTVVAHIPSAGSAGNIRCCLLLVVPGHRDLAGEGSRQPGGLADCSAPRKREVRLVCPTLWFSFSNRVVFEGMRKSRLCAKR